MIKMWKIKGRDISYDENELIEGNKNDDIKAEDYLINVDLPYEIKVQDSIYAFYLSEYQSTDLEAVEDIN